MSSNVVLQSHMIVRITGCFSLLEIGALEDKDASHYHLQQIWNLRDFYGILVQVCWIHQPQAKMLLYYRQQQYNLIASNFLS